MICPSCFKRMLLSCLCSCKGILAKSDVAAETQFQLGRLNLDFKCRISVCHLWYMKWRKILVSATAPSFLLFLEFHYNLNYIQPLWNRRKAFSQNLTSAKCLKLQKYSLSGKWLKDSVWSVLWIPLKEYVLKWLKCYQGITLLHVSYMLCPWPYTE